VWSSVKNKKMEGNPSPAAALGIENAYFNPISEIRGSIVERDNAGIVTTG
jgi:hypothetical protein